MHPSCQWAADEEMSQLSTIDAPTIFNMPLPLLIEEPSSLYLHGFIGGSGEMRHWFGQRAPPGGRRIAVELKEIAASA